MVVSRRTVPTQCAGRHCRIHHHRRPCALPALREKSVVVLLINATQVGRKLLSIPEKTSLDFSEKFVYIWNEKCVSAKLSVIYEAAADYKRSSVQLKNIADSRAQCDSMVRFL
jgi:hypothetical protein